MDIRGPRKPELKRMGLPFNGSIKIWKWGQWKDQVLQGSREEGRKRKESGRVPERKGRRESHKKCPKIRGGVEVGIVRAASGWGRAV